MSRGIPGGITQAGQVGVIFDCDQPRDPSKAGPSDYRGLVVSVQGGSANLRLTVSTLGGGSASVDFTVTDFQWLNAAGWRSAKLEVLSLGTTTTRIAWAWSAQQAPYSVELKLIQALDASGAHSIPHGAHAVTLGAADAGWIWSTTPDVTAAAVTFAQSIAAFTRVDVLGQSYQASAPVNAVWWISPL